MDGFYGNEPTVAEYAKRIGTIRAKYNIDPDNWIYFDPDLFRRGKQSSARSISAPISDLFLGEGIKGCRGNNEIINGITKVTQYLAVLRHHRHPITKQFGAPHLFVSSELDFFIDEITGYMWKKDNVGDSVDKPNDKNDHAMDTLKYLMTHRPEIARIIPFVPKKSRGVTRWTEMDSAEREKAYRYG
jgi:hypothetical protein